MIWEPPYAYDIKFNYGISGSILAEILRVELQQELQTYSPLPTPAQSDDRILFVCTLHATSDPLIPNTIPIPQKILNRPLAISVRGTLYPDEKYQKVTLGIACRYRSLRSLYKKAWRPVRIDKGSVLGAICFVIENRMKQQIPREEAPSK
ncbi:MAG: hypothetical protein AAB533_04180 [Patescibacteria group bacterium]